MALCYLDLVTDNVYVAILSLDGLCVIGSQTTHTLATNCGQNVELASMRLD